MKKIVFLSLVLITTIVLAACNGPEETTYTVNIAGPTTVDVGKSVKLTASVNPTPDASVTKNWTSSDTTKATVDQSGNVGGVAAGTITITYTVGKQSGTHQITVQNAANPAEREIFFEFDWEESDWNGEQAFNDGEGNNWMVNNGKAHTITNSGAIGYNSSWSFGYTPYDQGIHETVIEAKVTYKGSSVEDEPAAFSIRHLYSLHYDLQIFFENGDTYSGVRFYNSSASTLGDSTKVKMGGQNSDQEFVRNTEYVIKLVYDYKTETTTDIYVFVNNILELYLPNVAKQSENAKFGMGASIYSHFEVDYFKAYSKLASDLATPINPDDFPDEPVEPIEPVEPGDREVTGSITSTYDNLVAFRSFDFNESLNTAGKTILGGDLEGLGLNTDGEGYLSTLSATDTHGATPGWSSVRTPYDMNIPLDNIIEAKFAGFGTSTFAIRVSHATYIDYQLKVSPNEGEASINVYKGGSALANAQNLTVLPHQIHLLTLRYVKTADAASGAEGAATWGVFDTFIYVDNILVLTIEGDVSAGPAAYVAVCATTGSDVKVDYLRIYDPNAMVDITSQFDTLTKFKNFDFNDAANTAGSTILGDAYTEGTSFKTDGNGYLRTVGTDGNFGLNAAWSSARTGYDMNIPTNHVMEVKFHAKDGSQMTVRASHATYIDFTLKVDKDTGEASVSVYQQGSSIGGVTGLTVMPDEIHVFSIKYVKTADAAPGAEGAAAWGVYDILIYVDNVLVLTLNGKQSAGPAASLALAAQGNSDISVDYFRVYTVTD